MRITAVIKEMNYATTRMLELRLRLPDRIPDTYAEFLRYTSGGIRHEPSAARRAAGRAVS